MNDAGEADGPYGDDFLRNLPVARHPSERIPVVRPQAISIRTRAATLLATLPLLLALALLFRAAPWVLIVLVLSLAAAAFFLAAADASALRIAGHPRVASPRWVLLRPLVYFIVRARATPRLGLDGVGPLAIHLCVMGLVVFFEYLGGSWGNALTAFFQVPEMMPSGFAATIASRVANSASG